MLTLSQREIDRASVFRYVRDKTITARHGAELLGVTARHFRRAYRSWEREGDQALAHGLRGQPSNHAKPSEFKAWALEKAREPLFSDFGPTLLAEHPSAHPQAPGEVKASTLRLWMMEAGLWEARRRKARHRKARPRRAAFGELIQWDSSDHAWFEDRAPGRLVLIKLHDDATNRLQMARFVPVDDGPANRQIVIDYLLRHGRPVAFYTDKAGHFGQWTRSVSKAPLEEREAKRTRSIIRRALSELNVELIQAHSPQAKGRIERDFRTDQDRLVKEMRLLDISTLEEGNRYLEEVHIDYWNDHFAVQPAVARNAHRRLPKKADLEALFAETLTRTVNNDFTIRYDNRKWQIPKGQARGILPGHKVTVEIRLDGTVHFRFNKRYLELEVIEILKRSGPRHTTASKTRKPPVQKKGPRPQPIPPRPGPDHPWRKHNLLVANPRAIARYRSRQAASQPAPSSP
ncbi:MAG: ISNCY family transposase [Gemmatimonadales bacterium]|nr:MAG: ISNCY family transposase [Gemmatimonadales bacterium]